MNPWILFLMILGCIVLFILIFSLPRKKNKRIVSIEGIDDPEVAKAFKKMTNFFPFKILRRRIISELRHYELQGTLVDVGCGSGNLIVKIANEFKNLDLMAMDISKEILELAKIRAAKAHLDKIVKFKVGDVDNIPLEDKSIDFIVSSLSLHHWGSPRRVLGELLRILKDDGTILIFDFRRNSRKFFYGLLIFATKVVVPDALNKINEPLGSLKAGYTAEEVETIFSELSIKNYVIKPYLAWMFIEIKKP
jgi:ubiquinone/menaquinone biosynthesis C-methylase UbiE